MVVHVISVQELGPILVANAIDTEIYTNESTIQKFFLLCRPSRRHLFIMGSISENWEVFYKYILLLYWKQVPPTWPHWFALLHNERTRIFEKIFSWSCWVIWSPNCQNAANKLRNIIIMKLSYLCAKKVKLKSCGGLPTFPENFYGSTTIQHLTKKTALPVTFKWT